MTISESLIKRLNKQEGVTRSDIQDVFVQVCRDYNNIFANFFTRAGKSRCVMRVVEDQNFESILFINAQDLHISNFLKDCEEYNHDTTNYTCICWNSNKKYIGRHFGLIVIDEADNSLQNNLNFLKQVTWDKLIFLSATITTQQEQLIKSQIDYFKWVLPLEFGMKNGIIPYPKIFLKRIVPNKDQQYRLDEFTKNIKYWGEKGNSFKAIIQGNLRKQYFEKIKLEWFEKDNIFNRLKDKRTLFFLSDIKKSKELGNAVSSLETKKENIKILDQFNKGEISYIIAKNILERGVNVFDLNFAIFMTIKLKEKGLDQAFGRCLLGIAPNVIIPYCANTKEDKVIHDFLNKLKCEIQYI